MKKVLFNGLKTKKVKSGCIPCGQKRKTSTTTFATRLELELPSGANVTFIAGQVAEVAERDVEYLSLYGTTDVDGETVPVFEVIP